jgi:hypothetical protein
MDFALNAPKTVLNLQNSKGLLSNSLRNSMRILAEEVAEHKYRDHKHKKPKNCPMALLLLVFLNGSF